jgi:hypothetical protein
MYEFHNTAVDGHKGGEQNLLCEQFTIYMAESATRFRELRKTV